MIYWMVCCVYRINTFFFSLDWKDCWGKKAFLGRFYGRFINSRSLLDYRWKSFNSLWVSYEIVLSYSKQIVSLKYISDARIVKLSEQLKIMNCKEFKVCIWLLGLYPHFSDIILIWKMSLAFFACCADGHTKDCSLKKEWNITRHSS